MYNSKSGQLSVKQETGRLTVMKPGDVTAVL